MEEEIYDEEYDEDEYADVPDQKKKDDAFTLFQKIWRAPDSVKVGNLSNQELGMLPMDVRNNLNMSLLGETLNLEGFAEFFKARGEIICSTSFSKKGWFQELLVSQKKFMSKSSSQTMNLPEKKAKWNLYGKNKQQQMPQV